MKALWIKSRKPLVVLSLNESSQKTSFVMIAELLNIVLNILIYSKDSHQEALRSLSGFGKSDYLPEVQECL